MTIIKSSGETLRRYSVESIALPEGVSVVRRVQFQEVIQDGKTTSSQTLTHQFVVAEEDLKTAHAGSTPASAAKLFLLDPELVERLPRLLDAKPSRLDVAARTQGLRNHDLSAFNFPFSTVETQGPCQVCRWDQHYGWYSLSEGCYLAQPIPMGPKTGMTSQNYAFKHLLAHLEGRDDILMAGRKDSDDLLPLADRHWLDFHYCPDQDTYNRLVERSQQLAQAGYPKDLAYAVFDLDPLNLYDEGALKVTNLNHLMGRFDVANLHGGV